MLDSGLFFYKRRTQGAGEWIVTVNPIADDPDVKPYYPGSEWELVPAAIEGTYTGPSPPLWPANPTNPGLYVDIAWAIGARAIINGTTSHVWKTSILTLTDNGFVSFPHPERVPYAGAGASTNIRVARLYKPRRGFGHWVLAAFMVGTSPVNIFDIKQLAMFFSPERWMRVPMQASIPVPPQDPNPEVVVDYQFLFTNDQYLQARPTKRWLIFPPEFLFSNGIATSVAG